MGSMCHGRAATELVLEPISQGRIWDLEEGGLAKNQHLGRILILRMFVPSWGHC